MMEETIAVYSDIENDPNELENIVGNGLEIEEILLKELNKLQNIIL